MKSKFGKIVLRIFIALIIVTLGIFAWFMYSSADESSQEDKNEKLEKEIDYIDTKLTSLINSINGIQLENYKIVISKIQEKEDETNSGESQEDKSEKSGEEEQEESGNDSEMKITKVEQELTEVDSEKTNWDWIQGETEVFYSVWATIVLDLYDMDIEGGKIVEFSNTLDKALLSIKAKDKNRN